MTRHAPGLRTSLRAPALTVLAALALAVSACGSGDDDTGAGGASEDASATSPADPGDAPATGAETPSEGSSPEETSDVGPDEAEEPSASEDPQAGSGATGREPLPPELEPFDQGSTNPGENRLRPGDCQDSWDFGGGLEPMDCAEAHDMEVYYTFDLPEGEYPGATEVADLARPECDLHVEDYLGGPYLEDDTFLSVLPPEGPDWAAGNRQVSCVIVSHGERTGSLFGGGGTDT